MAKTPRTLEELDAIVQSIIDVPYLAALIEQTKTQKEKDERARKSKRIV